MKKYFVTGLMTLLPLAVTFAIVVFIFNLLTGPFVDLFSNILAYFGLGPENLPLLTSPKTFRIVTQVIILILLVVFTVVLGILTRWFFLNSLIHWGERILHRIPFISPVYKACSDVVKTIFTSNTGAFKQVVLVPYPKADTLSIGLITRESMPMLNSAGHERLIAVFIPTTPNPTSGFLVLYKAEDLTYLDMKIEDAFKYIISCGVITPPLTILRKDTIT
ncbi:MAG: DUF502 domain-containing protein [Chlamydiales bacterium]|nr:DUF502 domain-containing protein [Chlamydiales bacterium]